jgi:hypothetical protein
VAKPPLDQLLIDSALDPDLCRRLKEFPESVFPQYDLSETERELLRHPDHRLIPLLGEALARQAPSPGGSAEAPGVAAAPPTVFPASMLPDTLVALTVVPCAVREDGQLQGITYAAWVQPLPAGTDPATLPPPSGAALPGEPLAPLHAVIQISAVLSQDSGGAPQVGLWGSFLQSSNVSIPPPPESAGDPAASPFKSPFNSKEIQDAAAAVRSAPKAERYARLVDLLRVLHQGDVR